MLSARVSPIPYCLAMGAHVQTSTHRHTRPAPVTSDLLHPFIHALRVSSAHNSDVVRIYFIISFAKEAMTASVYPLGNKITRKEIIMTLSGNVENEPRKKKRLQFGDVLEFRGNLTFELPEIKGQRAEGL